MVKRILMLLVLVCLIMGCADEVVIDEEEVGESSKIITSEGKEYKKTDIVYEKDGEEFTSYFDPVFRDAMDWIRESTGGKFLCWWDYGHMIRGYAGNEVVIVSPSEDILWSLASGRWDESGSGRFSSKEDIFDVATALTSEDPLETRRIMEKHGADYIFVTERDIASSFVLFRIAGREEYLEDEYKANERAKDTILFRMIAGSNIEGFEMVYSDDMVRVYRVR